jgi:hypothetical protein
MLLLRPYREPLNKLQSSKCSNALRCRRAEWLSILIPSMELTLTRLELSLMSRRLGVLVSDLSLVDLHAVLQY